MKTFAKVPHSTFERCAGFLLLSFVTSLGCATPSQDEADREESLGVESTEGVDSEGGEEVGDELIMEEPGFITGIGDYLSDRALDLLDVASIRLILGPGLRVNVRATEVFQVGVGVSGSTSDEERGYSIPAYFAGLQRRQGGVWKQRTVEAGISLFYSYEASGRSLKGDKAYFGPADRGFFDVGFVAHAGIAGAEAELRLDEGVDFVLGFFAIDFLGDDRD